MKQDQARIERGHADERDGCSMRAMSSSPVRSTPTPEPRANTITFISPQSALLARYMVTRGHHHDKRRTPHTAHTYCAQLFRVTCTRINETADMDRTQWKRQQAGTSRSFTHLSVSQKRSKLLVVRGGHRSPTSLHDSTQGF